MKRKHLIERIINGEGRMPTNRTTILVTSKAPEAAQPLPDLSKPKPVTKAEGAGIGRDCGPPGYIFDKRGFTYGKLQVQGYAHSKVRERMAKGSKPPTKPPWWVGPGWAPFIVKKHHETDTTHHWWCICLSCKKELLAPRSTHALNRYEQRNAACEECEEAKRRKSWRERLFKEGKLRHASAAIIKAEGD